RNVIDSPVTGFSIDSPMMAIWRRIIRTGRHADNDPLCRRGSRFLRIRQSGPAFRASSTIYGSDNEIAFAYTPAQCFAVGPVQTADLRRPIVPATRRPTLSPSRSTP